MLSRPPAQEALKQFIVVVLYTDKDPRNREIQDKRFGTVALPLYLILGPDGRERERLAGRITEPQFLEFLKRGLQGSAPPNGGGR